MTKTKVTSKERINQNLVAAVPLREALINAIVHNDFSGQSRKDFFSCSSMPRNRELMRVFRDLGLVEQLGSGMSRILKIYDENIFEISEHFIKVVFPFSKETIGNGDENGDDSLRVLNSIKKQPDLTAKEMSENLGISTRKISRIIRKLKEEGKITRVGSDRKGYWKIN